MAVEKIEESFYREAQEHLEQISDALLVLEKKGTDDQTLQKLWRSTHSLKGSANIAGLIDIGEVSHAMENVLAAVSEHRLELTSEVVDSLLQAVDFVHAYLSAASEEGAARLDAQPMVAQLEELASQGEDILSKKLPDLSADIKDVLAEAPKRRLIELMEAGQHVFEISTYFKSDTFMSEIEELDRMLSQVGEVLCKSGTAEDAKEGYDLHFRLLLASPATQKALEDELEGIEATVRPLGGAREEAVGEQLVSDEAVEEKAPPVEAGEVRVPLDDIFQDPAMIELQEMFLEEGGERLNTLSRQILTLEEAPGNMELINELFRAYHSLKGTGGTYGFPIISTLAHELETFIDSHRKIDKPFTPEAIDLLLESVDVLGRIFEQAKAGSLDQSQNIPLIERIRVFLSSEMLEEKAVEGKEEEFRQEAPGPLQPLSPTVRPSEAARDESIRVGLGKLDHLVQIASEMILAKTQLDDLGAMIERCHSATKALQREWNRFKDRLHTDTVLRPILDDPDLRTFMDKKAADTDHLVDRLADIDAQMHQWSTKSNLLVDELQDEVLNVRMLPVASLFHPFKRTVRDLSRSSGKDIVLKISGEDTELDKRMMEEISDPLMHIIRNCVDHGIEPAGIRERENKPQMGTISLSAYQEGNQVVIEVEDDGAGIDPRRIKRTAAEKGLIGEEQAASLTDEEAIRLIFEPNFSTKEEVSSVSGRGVGMDVVKTNIGKVTGTVDVVSQLGKGTKFVLKLPLTLAVVQGLIVRCGSQVFCIQTTSVDEVFRLSEADGAKIASISGEPNILHEGHMLPLVRLADLLGLEDPDQEEHPEFAVVIRSVESKRIGLCVDELVREEGIVLKNLGTLVGPIENVAGAIILPNGDVAIVLDASALIRTAETKRAVRPASKPEMRAAKPRRPTVMVVDDSLIAREFLTSVVESYGYQVVAANNGVDALRQLRTKPCDLVITDIAMPVIDGFELTGQIKRESKLKHIPVIVVSAREDDDAKKRGIEAGADGFITKGAFEQRNLIDTIESFI